MTHLPNTIEHIKTADLVPYARNSRTHSPEQVTQLVASITEFGFTNPVLIDSDNEIIAGHGRVMAANQAGLDQVPCIRISHLTNAQKRAYIIADNKLALNAGWDEAMLRQELQDLKAIEFDLDVIGFDADELEDLFDESAPGDVIKDGSIPEKIEPKTKFGDIIKLGRHRLLCGDSSRAADIKKLLGAQTPDLLIYDPPYEVDEAWNWAVNATRALIFCDFKHMKQAMRVAMRYETVYQFIWDCCTSWYTQNRPLARHKTALLCADDKHFNFDDAVYQDGKNRQAKTVSNTRGSLDYQPLQDGFVHLQTVYQEPNTQQDDAHAHAKPVKWLNALMRGAGGQIVLDLFAGSGAAIIAAPDSMTVYAIEIDPAACDRIIARFESATDLEAVIV